MSLSDNDRDRPIENAACTTNEALDSLISEIQLSEVGMQIFRWQVEAFLLRELRHIRQDCNVSYRP